MNQENPHSAGVRRLAELMRRVNSTLEPEAVLEEVVHGVTEVLGFGVAAIARLDDDILTITNVSGPQEVRSQIIGGRTPVDEVLREFEQADHWGELRFVPHQRLSPEAIRSWWIPDLPVSDAPDAWHPLDALYAPLNSATGELLGIMAVDLPPGNRRPDPELRELLEMFTVQAGLVLSNAQQRHRLAEQVRIAETLRSVASAGNALDLQEILDHAARVVAEGYRARVVHVHCWADSTHARAYSAHHCAEAATAPDTDPSDSIDRIDVVDVVDGVCFDDLVRRMAPMASDDGRPQRLDVAGLAAGDQADPGGALDLLTAIGSAALMLIPLSVRGELLGGVLLVCEPEIRQLSPDELEGLTRVGRELAHAVLNARVHQTERRLVGELREIDRYKGELIATISHELKTPLTSIIGHTELLTDLETEVHSVSVIARNADRLNRLVDSLLNFSRVQDKRDYDRTPVDVVGLCANTVETLAMQAEHGDLTMRFSAPQGPLLVSGDADELASVVANILGNAVKYTPAGGGIEVAARVDGDAVEIVCADTGIGISETDQGHLFSAFSRSSNPEALATPGTGLGLAISQRIAEAHGGTITVESALGEGSTFRIRLPAYAAERA